MKGLVSDELKLEGICEQPGGYKKVFTSSGFTSILWSKDKKILTIAGKDSEQLKETLCSMLIGDHTALNPKQVGVTEEPNHRCQKTHACRCPDYSLDIESLHSGQMIHGQVIRTLGESITKVNEMLSELKDLDLVHQNTMLKIGEGNLCRISTCNDR